MAATCSRRSPPGVHLAVIDPEVGGRRRAIALRCADEDRLLVGPDNGLLALAAEEAGGVVEAADISRSRHRLEPVSATFHGRDLFAPVAARLARGDAPPGRRIDSPLAQRHWPADLPEVVYLDPYGNAATGLRGRIVGADVVLRANERCFQPVTTFGDAPAGTAIWYVNSSGLAELAISSGSAAGSCGLAVGTPVSVLEECP